MRIGWHWKKLSKRGPVQGFGKRLSSILGTYLSEYDMEAVYFDEGVRNSKRQLLESKDIGCLFTPAYTTMLGHLRSQALSSMLEFDKDVQMLPYKQADWDASRIHGKNLNVI
ncbi:hypothetical protein L3X38_022332 [Prunus dulcis]|uniref:Sey1/RHD3-like three-helix bundle domain-containing protein n=1 Tax=Prunus dulcis TaxID=3755 RepID=A0AAD4VWZ6_PRUDU|nr:hypothetical protein L3X38_022332 [Prunus dulcis]